MWTVLKNVRKKILDLILLALNCVGLGYSETWRNKYVWESHCAKVVSFGRYGINVHEMVKVAGNWSYCKLLYWTK